LHPGQRTLVIALIMAAALVAPGTAAAPATSGRDTTVAARLTRMPGTWMRLGDSEGTILARAQFPVVEGPKERGAVLRGGNGIWFGLAGQVTLQFRDGHLARAEYKIEDLAPYQVDYAHDQLRLAGYRPRCEQDDPGLQLCDWDGAAHVRLELRGRNLLARITTAGPAVEAPRPRRPAPAARRDTVPVFPQVFVLGRGAPAGVAPPALADSTPLIAPAYPERAREAGVQGRIWVRALVDTNGAVMAAEVLRSIPELDSAAVAVARRCRFKPYPPAGERVRFRVEIPVLFRAR
jgi:TonB family protein